MAGYERGRADQPLGDWRRAVVQPHSVSRPARSARPCSGPDLPQSEAEYSFEIVHVPIVGAELLLERGPLDEGGSRRVYAVQPLRQPCNRGRAPWLSGPARQDRPR